MTVRSQAYEVLPTPEAVSQATRALRPKAAKALGPPGKQEGHEVFTMMPADSTFQTYDAPHTASKRQDRYWKLQKLLTKGCRKNL